MSPKYRKTLAYEGYLSMEAERPTLCLQVSSGDSIEGVGGKADTKPPEVYGSKSSNFWLLSIDDTTDQNHGDKEDKIAANRSMSNMGSALNQIMKMGYM